MITIDIETEITLTLVEHTLRNIPGNEKLKAYDVTYRGEKIGEIEQFFPTFERSPEGSRIVSKRWKSKRARWAPHSPHIRNGYRSFQETRKAAVQSVVSAYLRAANNAGDA